jgi:hypothetical protein
VGTFFLNFFCGGIVSCFSAETTMSANVGGGPKIGRSSRTRESQMKTHNSRKTGRQRISESLYSPQKLWTPLHVPSCPFYRETKGLLHSEITPRI